MAPDASGAAPTVVLVETSDALPGLLPFQAWDALATAEPVWVREREAHPATPHLYFAGLDVEDLPPAALGREDLDLNRPGDPTDRRLAKALLARAAADGRVVYLLGSEDRGLTPALAGMAPDHDAQIELVFLAQEPAGTGLLQLVEVMRRLRDPDTGCPWDLKQDHASLVGYLIEETYELVDAIEQGEDHDLQEELGDLLLQIVFHARVAQDRGAFAIDDVARAIVDKLVRRHPHVFADGDASTPEQVQQTWDELKQVEKARSGPFDGVPAALPGLVLLETLQRKAARAGIATEQDPAARLVESVAELTGRLGEGGPEAVVSEEVGAVLAATVALARHLDVDPDLAARREAQAFRARFEAASDAGSDAASDASGAAQPPG